MQEEAGIIAKPQAAETHQSVQESGQFPIRESSEEPEEEQSSEVEREPRVSHPIETGYLVFDGHYVPPPYIVRQHGEEISVNDRCLPPEQNTGPSFGFGPGPGSGRWWGYGRNRVSSRFSRTEQQFERGALLFVLEDGTSGFIVSDNAFAVLEILLSDASNEDKVESLADGRFPRFDLAGWTKIVECFEKSADVTERVRQVEEEGKRAVEEALAARRRVEFFDSAPLKYGVTVIAMVLVVIALGSLLNHRPKSDARWRDVDQDGDRVAMVTKNVILLALLNGFDLALSLMAHQAGGFLELNPLGQKLIENPAYLAAFKLTALLTSCLILLMLRKYRGAQTASWWMCLVCTILTFRWLTYNSMFMT